MRDLHLQLLNLPQGTAQGYTLFSLNTSNLVSSGGLLGLHADYLTLFILTLPGSPSDPLHWIAPFLPGFFPNGPFDLLPGSVPFLAGTSLDGVAVALGPSWSFIDATNVVRITF